MLATNFYQQPKLLEVVKPTTDMTPQEIENELGELAPHIGRIQQAIAAQQAQLAQLEDRARQLHRAAKAQKPDFAQDGIATELKFDVHIVGGPTYIELMLKNWREITIDALEINPDKLREKILPFIHTGEGGQPEFLEGINLPLVPRQIEIINFDYQKLAALPLPSETSEIQPEQIRDPLNESLKKA